MNISKLALVFFLTLPLTIKAQKTATLIYIDQYKDIAISEMKRTGIPASITLAQGIIESNSGESNLALNYKNHFGIKCKSDWKGETTYQDDDAKQECFRVYPNSNASYIDHSNFLKTRPNYAPLFELDPVDDSAWAYGLKKAGYATASDYPKKLLKVINDFELSQYNFPELAFYDDEDTPTQKIDTHKKIEDILIIKDSIVLIAATSISTVKESINSKYIDTVQLSGVKGISSSDTIKITAPKAMKGIGSIAIEQVKDNALKIDATVAIDSSKDKKDSKLQEVKIIDTSKLITNTQNSTTKFKYPKGKFKANQLLAIYARAGSSFLELATTYNIALYKLYGYNDLEETDLLAKDQILYLVPKRKEINKKIHLVAAGESLYDISQNEGIQLSYLQNYNAGLTDNTLKVGATLVLFSSNISPTLNVKPSIMAIDKVLADTAIKKVEIKDTAKKKPFDFIKNISAPNFLKRKKNNE
jgi:LysM repeat protein